MVVSLFAGAETVANVPLFPSPFDKVAQSKIRLIPVLHQRRVYFQRIR